MKTRKRKPRKTPRPSRRRRPRRSAPTPVQDGPVPARWRKFYQRLLDLRNQLMGERAQLVRDVQSTDLSYSLHMADSGTDSFDRDFALGLLSADQNALYEIDAALKRMEAGTYGICELTGKPIPRARLEAIPWARFSAAAQRQLELEGAVDQRRLSARASVLSSPPEEREPAQEQEKETPPQPE